MQEWKKEHGNYYIIGDYTARQLKSSEAYNPNLQRDSSTLAGHCLGATHVLDFPETPANEIPCAPCMTSEIGRVIPGVLVVGS